MSTVVPNEPPRPHPAVETAFLAPEVVLWDGRHHRVHHFNPSASAVWMCVDGQLTADQITTELSEIFEMPFEVIRPDVDDAIAEFVRLGLLDGTDDSDAASPTITDGHHDHGHDHRHDEPVEEAPDDQGVVVLARPPDP